MKSILTKQERRKLRDDIQKELSASHGFVRKKRFNFYKNIRKLFPEITYHQLFNE